MLAAIAAPRAFRPTAARLARSVDSGVMWAAVLLCAPSASLAGSPPRLQFDMPPMAACHDVTTPEFAAVNPDERLIEVVIEASTLLVSGSEEDLVEFFFRITSPNRSLIVADYRPKTTLDSPYASTIAVEKKNESRRSAGLAINGAWDHLVHISGSGEHGTKDDSTIRYELHAPQEPVMSSGTVQRGKGVYFKIRPARQASLEGSRNFTMTFRAPECWRGDYLQVYCRAAGVTRGLVRAEPYECGRRDFFVALYLAGDAQAKARAAEMVGAEAALQKALIESRPEWDDPAKRSLFEPLSALWDREPPGETTKRQLERFIYNHEPISVPQPGEFEPPLDSALATYLEARLALRSLNGDWWSAE